MVVANSSTKKISFNEAYDYRVAIPVVLVAILGLLFVDVNGHHTVTLHNASSTSSKKLVSTQTTTNVSPASNLPTLNANVQTEDLSPGESPLDIQTASPQSSSSDSSSASNSSSVNLQNSSDNSDSNASSSPTTNKDTQAEVQKNIINGTTNEVIKVPGQINNTVKSGLNLL